MPISPTAEGFRAAFRRPSLTLGEIMWRWMVGATATAVFLFGFSEYLDTLPVTNGELLFLRTRHPYLVAEAIAHIFRGSLSRAAMAAIVAAMMLGMLWIIAASIERLATVRALVDYFRSGTASEVSTTRHAEFQFRNSWPALVRLNFLRIAVALAAILGFLGAAILAGFASPDAGPRPWLAFLLFLPLAGLICLAWSSLNWLLSLASMFAVRDGEDAAGAILAAVSFCRERARAISAVSTWTGLAHLAVFVGAATALSMPLGFAGVLPWRLIVLGMILVTLVYFALADWLYMARLAGYVCIAERPEALLVPPPAPMPLPWTVSPLVPVTPIQTTIDRDELILSDHGSQIPE
jgi:hypothetical protein